VEARGQLQVPANLPWYLLDTSLGGIHGRFEEVAKRKNLPSPPWNEIPVVQITGISRTYTIFEIYAFCLQSVLMHFDFFPEKNYQLVSEMNMPCVLFETETVVLNITY
jgi:hypothetical protein